MTTRTIKVLHVEDEENQRRVLAHLLGGLTDFHFEIRYADGVSSAMEIFRSGDVEFVFLDYNLHQGNGLQCLKALRMRDPIVPIIAISGMATAEVSGDLVAAGADDYINKRDLTTAVLAHSLRDSLRLADAWRKRAT